MKRIILLAVVFFHLFLSVQAQEIFCDHSEISYRSSFRLMGEMELRTQKDKSAPIAYRTLNHESGMKVSVLEILEKDTQKGKSGSWLYVMLTAPMWVDSGEWIEKYQKFLIFLPDDMAIFDFKK